MEQDFFAYTDPRRLGRSVIERVYVWRRFVEEWSRAPLTVTQPLLSRYSTVTNYLLLKHSIESSLSHP